MWTVKSTNYYVNAAIISAIGFFQYGPHTLLGLAVAEVTHKRATGTAMGIVGMFAGECK